MASHVLCPMRCASSRLACLPKPQMGMALYCGPLGSTWMNPQGYGADQEFTVSWRYEDV